MPHYSTPSTSAHPDSPPWFSFRLLLVLLALLVGNSLTAQADSGLYKNFVILRAGGNANTYYYTYAGIAVPNAPFQNATLGVFDPAASTPGLILNGAEANTYDGNGATVQAARLFYRVYAQGMTPGPFLPIELTYQYAGIDGGANNRKWDRTDANIDLVQAAGGMGQFVVEAYFQTDVSYAGQSFQNYDSNNAANYRATFTVAPPTPAAGSYRASVDDALVNLDKSQIPTGILYDRVFPLARLDIFNQSAADTSSYQHFLQATQELNTASYRYTGLPTTAALKSRIQAVRQTAAIPIGILHYEYNLLDTMAVYDGRLTQSDRLAPLYDVLGRTASPYVSRTTLVASILATDVPQGTSFFTLPTTLRLDNTTDPVTGVDIDFGDGAGLSSRPLGTTFTASFHTLGVRFVRFVVHLSSGQQIATAGFVNVVPASSSVASRTASGSGQANRATASVAPCIPTIALTNVAAFTDYTGTTRAGRGDVDYFFSDCVAQSAVKKPIIVMDGLDFVNKQTGLDERNGEAVYSLLGYEEGGPKNLGEDLRQAGYDVVVLNFPGTGGADFIERNAFVLIELIQRTNRTLRQTATSSGQPLEKLVIIGPSMGGLISRYALTYMEKQYNDASNPATYRQAEWDHNTRLWVAFDSPQLGANVPLGAQKFLKFYSEKVEQESATDNLRNLNEPAPRQLLVDHHLGNSNGTAPVGAPGYRDRFQIAVDQLGYPELNGLRRIAISNGSQGGIKQFSYNRQGQAIGCQEALNFRIRTGQTAVRTLVKLFFSLRYGPIGLAAAAASSLPITLTQSSIRFTPDYGANCKIFDGRALSFGSQDAYATGRPGSSSYDVAPGGTRSTQQEIVDSGPKKGDAIPNKFLRFVLAGQYQVPEHTNLISEHAFIPTVSGLGLTNPNRDLAENLTNRDLVCSVETPFDAYYAPRTTNEGHIVLNVANVAFLKREILQQTPTPVIAGSNLSVCSDGGQATISVIPECAAPRTGAAQPATTYFWTVSSGLKIVGGQGTTSVVVQSVVGFDGNSNVQVLATRSGSTPNLGTKSVWIGTPGITATYTYAGITKPVLENNEIGPGMTIINATTQGGTFQPWSFGDTGGQGAYNLNNNSTGVLNFPSTNSTGCSVNIVASNSCGTGRTIARFYSNVTRFAMYPNPANESVDVATDTDTSAQPTGETQTAQREAASTSTPPQRANSSPATSPRQVRVYNSQGRLVFEKTHETASSLHIVTRDWPEGLYHVTVQKGKDTTRKQLSVQH